MRFCAGMLNIQPLITDVETLRACSCVQALQYPTEAQHQPINLFGPLCEGDIEISFQVEQMLYHKSAIAKLENSSLMAVRSIQCLRFYKKICIGLTAASPV